MKILSALLLMCAFLLPAFAAENQKEEDRVKEAGQVLKEILNIPDNIPQDLLDKAECLIILPSVKKGAFGIGGSYGRGVMICRSGEHYTDRVVGIVGSLRLFEEHRDHRAQRVELYRIVLPALIPEA